MQLAESESPTTGQGRRADSKTSFLRLTQQPEYYRPPSGIASIKASKHAIAWRYREARQRRDSSVPPIVRFRIAELERIIHDQWRGAVPDTSDGLEFINVVVNHLVGFSKSWRKRLDNWCGKFAPWLDEEILEKMINLATRSPTFYMADTIARKIKLDIETRDRLGIKTIGAYDFDKKARDERRLRFNAARKRQKRAERGATPRAECFSQKKPWLAEGISERTWYRRKKEKHS